MAIIDSTAPAQAEAPPQQASAGFSVPDAFRTEKVFEGVKSVDDVFKMALEGQKMIGRGVFLPDDKDPDDVKADKMSKVYNRLGRPETADKYDPKVKTTLPAGHEWNQDALSEFGKIAHSAGLSNSQFQAVLDFYAGQMSQSAADPAVAARDAKAALVEEWGESGYELHMNEAHAAARLVGGKDFLDFLDQSRMGDNPTMIKFLAKIGRDLREGGVIDDSIIHGVRTSGDYESEAKQIISDPKDPYNQPRHARHRERVEYVNRLFEMSLH